MSAFARTRRRSFSDRKKGREKAKKTALVFLLYIAVYLLFVNFVLPVRVLENESMAPTLERGDRLMFFSFGFYHVIPGLSSLMELPVERGNLVLADFTEARPLLRRLAASLVRFFTVGRFSFDRERERVFIKRVIALPGDEVTITNYVARVRPALDPYTYTEYECSGRLYYNNIPENNALWDDGVPFSGTMDALTLGEDEYFLLSDDRANTNDSRTWGPVPAQRIAGKALLRFWPPAGFGTL